MRAIWRVGMFLPVPVLTVLLMWWDRTLYPVVSSPQAWERTLAGLVWCGSLTALIVLPILLSVRWKFSPWTHSVVIDLILAVGAALYLVGVIEWKWPRWPKTFNSDLEVVAESYFVSAVAFSLALYETIRSYRSGNGLTDRRGSVALLCGAVALISSFLLVFFE